jgi:hypothetical protein
LIGAVKTALAGYQLSTLHYQLPQKYQPPVAIGSSLPMRHERRLNFSFLSVFASCHFSNPPAARDDRFLTTDAPRAAAKNFQLSIVQPPQNRRVRR